jgi:hypothetical protein
MRSVMMAMMVAAVGLGTATPVRAQDAVAVGPDEVKKALVGKVWRVELPNGAPAVEHFNADGTAEISGGLTDAGTWRLWEQGYCTQWRRMRHGQERCFTLDRTADGKYRIYKPDGEISMTIVGFE